MAEACTYTNQYGIKCGRLKHDSDTPHELTEQITMPAPFVLKASDPFTLCIIRAWITVARISGVNPIKLAKAEDHYYQIYRWQKVNGTKLPD